MSDYFEIKDEDLSVLKNQVVVITGCSSGIGLATTKLLLSLDAKVVAGDLNPPPVTHPNLVFQKTNVTSWTELTGLFSLAYRTHNGRIDHVFANAGIGESAHYLDLQTDSLGNLVEPSFRTVDINLRGVLNTSALAFHYMRTQQPAGGSVIVTASASSFQRFGIVDYATAKHGVLGFMRAMIPLIKAVDLPIRVNGIAPSWTVTGLLPPGYAEAAGKGSQSADVVARSAAVLMADHRRNGHLIYSAEGRYREIDEAVLLKANEDIFRGDLDDNIIMERINARIEKEKRQIDENV